jgi:hypothetical protein
VIEKEQTKRSFVLVSGSTQGSIKETDTRTYYLFADQIVCWF